MPPGPSLADAVAPLRRDPERAALLFDVDGTLAPIVRHADEAQVPEEIRKLLVDAARRYGVVACVSGRRASDARRIVGIGSLHYLGTHGMEVLSAGSSGPRLDPDVEREMRRVHEFGAGSNGEELARLRVRTEDKGPIVAFHWRGVPDETAAQRAVAELAREAEAEGLAIHWGRKVLEVRPPVRIDKGAGIVSLLGGESVNAALYAGDDVTDLDAFRGLAELRDAKRLRDIVRVGIVSDEGPSAIAEEADVTVTGTQGVRDLLAALVAEG